MPPVKENSPQKHSPPKLRDEFDIAMIGGGFRTVSFLSSNPALLDKDIAIVEAGPRLGSGGFADLVGVSSSVGNAFFRHVQRDGPWGWLYTDPVAGTVASCERPVGFHLLSTALDRVGDVIKDHLPRRAQFLDQTVTRIDLGRSANFPVGITFADGTSIRCRRCVLATGRHELLHPYLVRWLTKVWCSRAVLSLSRRRLLTEHLSNTGNRPIVILGCSHSAFACLEVILQTGENPHVLDSKTDPHIFVVQRRPVRLYHESLSIAQREHIVEREEAIIPSAHVCPKTGIVFRDTGLRHNARDLYCSIWRGERPSVRMYPVGTIEEIGALLDTAALIVQALGYVGRYPPFFIDDIRVSPVSLIPDDCGFLSFPFTRAPSAIAALRVEPTPLELRDNGAYASSLYANLGRSLLTSIAVTYG